MKNITGYRIFHRYLEIIWETEEHDLLGGLLGGMSLLDDGSTADPAYGYDWDNAVTKADDEPYQAGIFFLKNWLDIGYIEEIGLILKDMEDRKRLDLWEKAEYDVIHGLDDPRLRFKEDDGV